VFFIDPEVFAFAPLNLVAEKLAQKSNDNQDKSPFPAVPYRGYNVLGAGFNLLEDQFADWCQWDTSPDLDPAVWPANAEQVLSALRRILQDPNHPHWSRGVGVLVKFLQACQARPDAPTEHRS
jgi:hypothetical protein